MGSRQQRRSDLLARELDAWSLANYALDLEDRLRIAEEALTDVCEVGDRAAVQIARAALSRIQPTEEK